MLGRPHRLRIDLDGVPQAWLDSFWASPRSHAKRAFMERMLGTGMPAMAANEALARAAA
jgi:hypothetical protein